MSSSQPPSYEESKQHLTLGPAVVSADSGQSYPPGHLPSPPPPLPLQQPQFSYPPQQIYAPPPPINRGQYQSTVYPATNGYLPQATHQYPASGAFVVGGGVGGPYGMTAAGGARDMVYLNQPAVSAVSVPIPLNTYGFNSKQTICHLCSQQVVTQITHKPGKYAWCMCAMLVFMGFACPLIWLGICLIPFCVKSCKDVVHTCPSCKQHIRTVPRGQVSNGLYFY